MFNIYLQLIMNNYNIKFIYFNFRGVKLVTMSKIKIVII